MRWLWRIPSPFQAFTRPENMVWCDSCRDWKGFDTIPGVQAHDVPAFTVCAFCGCWIPDFEETA